MLAKFDIDPANVDPNGIAAALPTGTDWSLAADAEWLLDRAGDELAHILGVTTAGNEPAGNSPVMTLTGTDADGNVITEDVTLPNATLVETTKYFLTVTSATTGANETIDTVDIGWVDEVASKTFLLNHHQNVPSNYFLDVTGTISVTVQVTIDDIGSNVDQQTAHWIAADASLTAETGDSTAAITVKSGYTGGRIILNSYTDTAEAQLYATQAE